MLRAVLKKMINKFQLNLCLFLGMVLLIAVMVCHPLLLYGGESLIIRTEFEKYIENNNEYPAIRREGAYRYDGERHIDDYFGFLKAYQDKWTEYIKLPILAQQNILKLPYSKAADDLGDLNINLSIYTERNLPEHISIIKGQGLLEAKLGDFNDNKLYPCVVSGTVADALKLVVGERVNYRFQLDANEKDVELYIAGIFDRTDDSDVYWSTDILGIQNSLWVLPETMDDILSRFGAETISFNQNVVFDYTKITPDNADDYLSYIKQFADSDALFKTGMISILSSYSRQAKSAAIILFTFELPCLILLIMFIFMVSQRISSAEESEIAVWRSRGMRRPQIMRMYLLQSVFLAIPAYAAGTGLGYGLCCINKTTIFIKDAFIYAAIAAVLSVICIIAAVFRKTKATVVYIKSNNKYGRKSVISKFCPDIILLIVSIYLLINYSKQISALSEGILEGRIIDPLVFINGSLFIFASGLFIIRICRYLVNIIYRIGRRIFKAASYSAILQAKRTFSETRLLSVFLVMTIAGGVYNAGLISTLDIANTERVDYNIAADARVSEKWKSSRYVIGDVSQTFYDEPDYGRFEELVEDGIAKSVTRLRTDNTAILSKGKNTISDCINMSVITDEFGRTAFLKDGLNDSHWYNMLNSLSVVNNGVILSRNAADDLGVAEGDKLELTKNNASGIETKTSLIVTAVIDDFPAYVRYTYLENEAGGMDEKDNYLAVTNYAYDQYVFDNSPYEVWIKLAEGKTAGELTEAMSAKNIVPYSLITLENEHSRVDNGAIITIIKSIINISLIISSIISIAGFMIYWIISIKSRELLFGVYRAMGMHMSGVSRILLTEITFCSLLPAISAIGIGMLTSSLFTKLSACACLPEKHNLELVIKIDLERLELLGAVLIAIFLICFLLLRVGIRRMNISKVIKLGED